ncbi:hypothetical protein DPMN_098905 [Dreissena polymorpha]|uniref:Uncharacterized protein n=1 Tax=Dreissena polymorpha TaxID=45954 RepID=A0A9D4R640_DREPO|nr:hypothetical protein DPMN_098905 [Dreissena polymorpha]
MQQAVERFLKVDKVVEYLTLALKVFLNDDSAVEDLFHCSESSIIFRQQFLGFTFQSV